MIRLVLALLCFVATGSSAAGQPLQAGQPIPFSHRQHSEQAHLTCSECHRLAASGEVFSIPKGPTCMSCHQEIAKNSRSIKDLSAYVAAKEPVPWVRIYEIPGFVEFSHKTHLDGKVKCEACHGPVATRDYLWRETDMSMGGCFSCHQQHNASTSCHACHNLD